MEAMKILVTGGTGYIGSHTVVELIQSGHEVEILDNLYNSDAGVLLKIAELAGVEPKFYEVELRDKTALKLHMRDGGYEAVIHFAGLKAVAESVENPLTYYENNVGGTVNLLEAMEEFGVRKLIFSSSATVYGDQEAPFVETMETGRAIANPYGRTKYMIEEIIKDLCKADEGFEATILRYFNPIGAHESGLIGEEPKGIPNNLMPIIMKVATGEMAELLVCGDDYETTDGSAERDYIHVMDLAQGHVAAIAKMQPGVTVYNLGTGRGVSVLEMVKAFEKVSGSPLTYKIVGRRAGDLAVVYADASKAERELGWKATRTVDEAMRDTLKFLGLSARD